MRKYILTSHEAEVIKGYLILQELPWEKPRAASATVRSIKRRARNHLPKLKEQIALLEKLIQEPEVTP